MKIIFLHTLFFYLLLTGDAKELRSGTSSEAELKVGDDDNDQVCVTLESFGNRECHGGVQGTYSFVVLNHPGSPCMHNANMKNNSVKNQYCEVAQQLFHQTVYVSDKNCHVSWAQKAFSPLHLQYTPEKCMYGYKLKSCTLGACPEVGEELKGIANLQDFESFLNLDAEAFH